MGDERATGVVTRAIVQDPVISVMTRPTRTSNGMTYRIMHDRTVEDGEGGRAGGGERQYGGSENGRRAVTGRGRSLSI